MKKTAAIVPAAFVLALMSVTAAIPAGCAHVNSPTGFIQCMADSKDEAAALQLLYAALDQNAVGAIEAALRIAPDAIRCLLERTAAAKGAGPVEQTRAKRAREFLEAHQLSNVIFKKGGGADRLAAGVSPLPLEGPAADDAPPAAPAADDAGDLSFAIHWALPFEQHLMVLYVSAAHVPPACPRDMHDLTVPPFAFVSGRVCVTDDFTFDVDYRGRPERQAQIDRRTLLEI